ncbi:hypothetical protein Saso_09000 [Streptomyces asoensis]|uniref:Uncharacterized protein n=1 Tax=Streptomyces asoensis TaxID=249586 RepID=A0ABQ3RU05_9ACTN|nr:hypothetical protein GCM10010496_69350 [Streptomyces asoensis]GHI59250.1 hypothetical protein Saso_09000 [Streptomyces asoensis]
MGASGAVGGSGGAAAAGGPGAVGGSGAGGDAVSGAEGAGDGGAEPGPRPSARLRPADPPEAGGEASFEVMASAGYR